MKKRTQTGPRGDGGPPPRAGTDGSGDDGPPGLPGFGTWGAVYLFVFVVFVFVVVALAVFTSVFA